MKCQLYIIFSTKRKTLHNECIFLSSKENRIVKLTQPNHNYVEHETFYRNWFELHHPWPLSYKLQTKREREKKQEHVFKWQPFFRWNSVGIGDVFIEIDLKSRWAKYVRFDFVLILDVFTRTWTCSFDLPLWWHLFCVFCIHERLHYQLDVNASVLSKTHVIEYLSCSVAVCMYLITYSFSCAHHFPPSIRLMFAYAPNMKHTSLNLCQNWQLLACISDWRKWNELYHFKCSSCTHTNSTLLLATQELPQQAQIRIHISDQTE